MIVQAIWPHRTKKQHSLESMRPPSISLENVDASWCLTTPRTQTHLSGLRWSILFLDQCLNIRWFTWMHHTCTQECCKQVWQKIVTPKFGWLWLMLYIYNLYIHIYIYIHKNQRTHLYIYILYLNHTENTQIRPFTAKVHTRPPHCYKRWWSHHENCRSARPISWWLVESLVPFKRLKRTPKLDGLYGTKIP